MAEYRWDAAEMKNVSAKLDDLAERLEQEKKMLVSSVIVLSDEWKGAAGSEYLKVSAEDAAELEKTISHCRSISNALKKISENCYSECERNIMNYKVQY